MNKNGGLQSVKCFTLFWFTSQNFPDSCLPNISINWCLDNNAARAFNNNLWQCVHELKCVLWKKLLWNTQKVHVPLKQQKLFTMEIVGMETSLHENFQIYGKRQIQWLFGLSSLQNTAMEITVRHTNNYVKSLPYLTAHWAHHKHNTNSHF